MKAKDTMTIIMAISSIKSDLTPTRKEAIKAIHENIPALGGSGEILLYEERTPDAVSLSENRALSGELNFEDDGRYNNGHFPGGNHGP